MRTTFGSGSDRAEQRDDAARQGVKQIVDYAAVSGARSRIDLEQLSVRPCERRRECHRHAAHGREPAVLGVAFAKAADAVIDNFIFNSKEEQIIDTVEADIGEVPDSVRPKLVALMKSNVTPITNANAKYRVPLLLTQINGHSAPVESVPMMATIVDADAEFEVDTEDTRPHQEVSGSAVKCAAQFYYSMVVGDELDVFNAVNFFTHKTRCATAWRSAIPRCATTCAPMSSTASSPS